MAFEATVARHGRGLTDSGARRVSVRRGSVESLASNPNAPGSEHSAGVNTLGNWRFEDNLKKAMHHGSMRNVHQVHCQLEGLWKVCPGGVKRPRTLILSHSKLISCFQGTDNALDEIPLHSIKSIEEVDHSSLNTSDNILLKDGSFIEKSMKNLRQKDEGKSENYLKIMQVLEDDTMTEIPHVFTFAKQADLERFKEILEEERSKDIRHYNFRHRIMDIQSVGRAMYWSGQFQTCVAILIMGNFAVDIYESQAFGADAEEAASDHIFYIADVIFTSLFAAELLFNMMVHVALSRRFLGPFFASQWNIFDFIVVLVSLLALAATNVPSVNYIRTLRVFRVFRLFGRLQALRRTITAIGKATIPVLNVLCILFLVMAVYAMLGVKLFGHLIDFRFDNFLNAFVTMFQIVTYDNWSSDIIEPIRHTNNGELDAATVLFFLSFICIVAWCLLPVVIATLLESYIETTQREEHASLYATSGMDDHRVLDPLLQVLSFFHSQEDLTARISILFSQLDYDRKTTIGYNEMREAIQRLSPWAQPLSRETFAVLTDQGWLTNEDGELTPERFEIMMRRELDGFILRQAANWMAIGDGKDQAMLSMLKAIMLLQKPSHQPMKTVGITSPLKPQIRKFSDIKGMGSSRPQTQDPYTKVMEKLQSVMQEVEALRASAHQSSSPSRAEPVAVVKTPPQLLPSPIKPSSPSSKVASPKHLYFPSDDEEVSAGRRPATAAQIPGLGLLVPHAPSHLEPVKPRGRRRKADAKRVESCAERPILEEIVKEEQDTVGIDQEQDTAGVKAESFRMQAAAHSAETEALPTEPATVHQVSECEEAAAEAPRGRRRKKLEKRQGSGGRVHPEGSQAQALSTSDPQPQS